MANKPSTAIVLLCLFVTACGGRLTGGDTSAPQTVAAAPLSTPSQRATQVAWTAASARYCAFGLNPQKLKADYLAWESSRGTSADEIASLGTTYDKAFLTFYDKVKETPGYCSKAKIEEIRPEINRHLAGDYEPPKKPLPPPEKADVKVRAVQEKMDREKIFDPRAR